MKKRDQKRNEKDLYLGQAPLNLQPQPFKNPVTNFLSRKEESKANYLPIIKEEFNDNDHNSIIHISESNSDTDCNN